MTSANAQKKTRIERLMDFHERRYRRAKTPAERLRARVDQCHSLLTKMPPQAAAQWSSDLTSALLAEIQKVTKEVTYRDGNG